MQVDWDTIFTDGAKRCSGSQIRSYFSHTEKPEVISFAGGFPDSRLFPTEKVSGVLKELALDEGANAFGYSSTEGSYQLRSYLAGKMNRQGVSCKAEDLLITNGSQQGLDLIFRILVHNRKRVLVEEPGYIGGLGAIRSHGGDIVGVPVDSRGLCPVKLEKALEALAARKEQKPELIYTVPNFQNPTGCVTSLDRRKRIYEIAGKYNLIIVEDDPYREFCYEGEVPPSYKSMDKEGRVVYLGSYSKIFLPGIRVGWMVAPPPLLEKAILAKQTTDLCSNSLGQLLAYRLSVSGYLDQHVTHLMHYYTKKRDAMLESMRRHFPRRVSYTRPRGGFYVWVSFPSYYPASPEMLGMALERKVAFVHGEGFFGQGGRGADGARFSFSQNSPEEIEEGIKRLGELFGEVEPCKGFHRVEVGGK